MLDIKVRAFDHIFMLILAFEILDHRQAFSTFRSTVVSLNIQVTRWLLSIYILWGTIYVRYFFKVSATLAFTDFFDGQTASMKTRPLVQSANGIYFKT